MVEQHVEILARFFQLCDRLEQWEWQDTEEDEERLRETIEVSCLIPEMVACSFTRKKLERRLVDALSKLEENLNG